MFFVQRPKLSVVVVVYRMQREAPRTLYSLSTRFQLGMSADDYEVIVVENQSDQMLSAEEVTRHGRQFSYIVNRSPSKSPAGAMNLGARKARGEYVMLMVDGARIASPGLLQHTIAATQVYKRAVVATLGWHLGPDNQARSVPKGYCQSVEDELLNQSQWEVQGYELFSISSLAGSCSNSWFFPILESNAITVRRKHYRKLGGFCEKFQTPGGGFVNLDFYRRAVRTPRHQLVMLLGEGTFHQVHGGVATNRTDNAPIRMFQEEYLRIRGKPYTPPGAVPFFLGQMPEPARVFLDFSFEEAQRQARSRLVPSRPAAESSATAPQPVAAQPVAAPVRRGGADALVVVGMHRSGTSCLAGTLMECGVDFGEVWRINQFNQKGNNEHQLIMDLHDRLLRDNGGSWKEPPEKVEWSPEHLRLRDEVVEQFQTKGSPRWGFKDPRTLLAYEAWLEALPEMKLVGIFRHPDAVCASLAHRNQFSREAGLGLWYRYNARMLALYERREFPIIFFSEDPDEVRVQLETLIPHVSLEIPAQGFSFYEPALQHFLGEDAQPLPTHCAALYERLHAVRWKPAQAAPAPSQRRAA